MATSNPGPVDVMTFMGALVDAMGTAAAASQDGHGSVHGTVEAVVIAQGNSTMHVAADVKADDGKPTFTLTVTK